MIKHLPLNLDYAAVINEFRYIHLSVMKQIYKRLLICSNFHLNLEFLFKYSLN